MRDVSDDDGGDGSQVDPAIGEQGHGLDWLQDESPAIREIHGELTSPVTPERVKPPRHSAEFMQ